MNGSIGSTVSSPHYLMPKMNVQTELSNIFDIGLVVVLHALIVVVVNTIFFGGSVSLIKQTALFRGFG